MSLSHTNERCQRHGEECRDGKVLAEIDVGEIGGEGADRDIGADRKIGEAQDAEQYRESNGGRRNERRVDQTVEQHLADHAAVPR